MQTVRMVVKTDADGKLHIDLPTGWAESEFEVVLVWQPKAPAPEGSPESRGWPPGFVEQTYGSIQDEAFRRYPQGEYEKRPELE
jgi:hypothetical protein